ncbi:MAG: transposase, partial [Nitrosomonas sp.]|uniref:transposase n=1 Tax=Nitrosomonas sp. TaxID=42353 RepID=UPI0025F6B5FB
MAILKQAEAGVSAPDLCHEHGMSSATFYKWHSKYGGMDASLMARFKELEDENRRLKKMYVEERIKSELRQEALEKMVVPQQRRDMINQAVKQRKIRIRLACKTYGISENCYRYRA